MAKAIKSTVQLSKPQLKAAKKRLKDLETAQSGIYRMVQQQRTIVQALENGKPLVQGGEYD